jgi:geranylgeranyl reductase family protein
MYDVIVIGGGPAGSSAARKASSLGLKTLLIEKENFPRYKPCGGAVSDVALSYLDFRIPPTIPEKEMRGIRIIYKGQKFEKYAPQRIGILVDRKVFDDYLLKMAGKSGAEIITGERAVDFADEEGRVIITTEKGEYEAYFLIIAEGAHGNLQYKVKDRPRKNEYAISFVAEVKEDDETINKHLDNIIEVHTGVLKMGFGWVFPHRGYYSVGIAGLAKYLDNPKKKINEFLDLLGFPDRHPIISHLIPAGGIKRRLTASRVVVAGDAAGFVDSFYGEGISYAIRSGQIASETISRIMERGGSVTLDDYSSRVKSEFEMNLKYSLMMSRFANSFPLFFALAVENEGLVDKFIEIALQKVTYRDLLKWLFPRLPGYLFRHILKKISH